jgi:ABC-type proline/glycine betaine transport system permease subunit
VDRIRRRHDRRDRPAIAFSLSKAIEAGVMPLVLLLRTIPLVSIAPVIILVTGRGTPASVAVIGTVVVLFPALANVLFGLSRASQQSLDVVHVFGGGRFTALRKVNLPGALPSVFAAARVSVPGRDRCAAGGVAVDRDGHRGIDPEVQRAGAVRPAVDLDRAHHADHLVLYNLVQIVENIVLARMGMATSA